MSRGKFAERARTKRAADVATSTAIAEQNRLRARIHQLEHVEAEQASLKRTIERLRLDVAAGEGPKVRQAIRERDEALERAAKMLKERNERVRALNALFLVFADTFRELPAKSKHLDSLAEVLATYGEAAGWDQRSIGSEFGEAIGVRYRRARARKLDEK